MSVTFDFSYHNWSTNLIQRELWYKVRRELAQQLEARGIWLPRERFIAIRNERRAVGRVLQRKLLDPILGRSDYVYLRSEFAFGVLNRDLYSRLPLILSLGHDLGLGIYFQLLRGEVQHRNVAALCALLNLGIAVFDRICDDLTEDAEELYRFFDEDILHHLTNDPTFCQELAELVGSLPGREVRIVLKVICAFFSRLHDWSLVSRGSPIWAALNSLLIESYRSEMRTVRANSLNHSPPELIDAAARKSTLPFAIMLQIGRVCAGATGTHEVPAVDELIGRIGAVFSLVDDLMDLSRDIESGSINTILLRAGGSLSFQQWSPQGELARYLLTGDVIEDAIDSLCTNIKEVVQLLESSELHSITEPQLESQLQDSVLTYMRNWIGS